MVETTVTSTLNKTMKRPGPAKGNILPEEDVQNVPE